MVQNLLIWVFSGRIGIDPEHHIDLIAVNLDPLDQGTNELASRLPIRECQSILHLGAEVLEPPNNQAQLCLQRFGRLELLGLLLQGADPLPQARDPRLKFVPFDKPFSIAIDQAPQPTS
jgi:hypothetical protein